jgi:hypothetical protein
VRRTEGAGLKPWPGISGADTRFAWRWSRARTAPKGVAAEPMPWSTTVGARPPGPRPS